MFIATSQTISKTLQDDLSPDEIKEFSFSVLTGNDGISHIQDELLDTEAAAEQRATAEFLKNGYRQKSVKFETYRTDLKINQEINVRGLWYKIKEMSIKFGSIAGTVTITAVRYE